MNKNISYNPCLKSDVQYVFELTNQLNNQLAKAYTNGSIASVICGKAKNHYSDNKTEQIEHISIKYEVEKDGLICATEAFSDYHIQTGASHKQSRRTIGYMHIYPSDIGLSIIETIKEINTTKGKVEQHIKSTYKTQNERFYALRDASNGLMTLHLYRNIRCTDEIGVSKIGFAWNNKKSITKANKNNLLSALTEQMKSEIQSGSDVTYISKIINTVATIQEEKLRVVRQVNVQPTANIISEALGAKTVTASLPIIIVQASKPKIILPTDYYKDRAKKYKRRSDSQKRELIGCLRGNRIEAIVD